MKSKRKKIILGVLAIIIGLPVALILTVVAWISISDKTNGTIVSSGQKRRYLLYVPKTYDPSKATPLVISLHPAASWPAAERNIKTFQSSFLFLFCKKNSETNWSRFHYSIQEIPMKKFLLSTILIFTFPVIAVQNQVPVTVKKQPTRKTASFDPNTVTLVFSGDRSPHTVPNLPQGCLVDAWVGYVDKVQGIRQNNQGWTVTYLYSGPGPVPPPSTTDQHGFVLNKFIGFNTTVRATVVVNGISTVNLYSDFLTCTNHLPTKQ